MEYINNYNINILNSRIREGRERKEMTQQNLADEMGVQRQAIISWEKKGKNSTPSLENLIELCIALDCSLDYLLGLVDTPEIELISKASHYSGISSEIIRYGIEHSDYLDCLNFFMHPNNCAELFKSITLDTWKKYWINSNLEEIKNPFKDELINAFNEYYATTPIFELNKDTYRAFLKRKFPKEKLIISSSQKENGFKLKGCFELITYQKFSKNKDFDYASFINYLVKNTFEPLSNNLLIELQKNKLSNTFVNLFTKYLDEMD